MSNVNPYAPSSNVYATNEPGKLKIAGQTQRFLTSILDNIFLFFMNSAVGFVIGILLAVSGGITQETAEILNLFMTLIGVFLSMVYYTLLEATTGRTLGKLIMGTQVLSRDGGKPTLGQCAGRSACRLIPFEAFSFLIGTDSRFPIGWHDRFAGTVVVSTRK